MGKPIRSQRRGKGGHVYRSPSHRHRGGVRNPRAPQGLGVVVKLDDDPGRTAPLAVIRLENGERYNIPAAEGMYEGQKVEIGPAAPISVGNVLPVGMIPEGTAIYNIELLPGDGGKIARAAGTYGVVVSHGEKTVVQLPSERYLHLHNDCRAVVGVIAGSGRKERPFGKAGKVYHALRSRAKEHVKVRGIAMNPVNHPHGGGGHQHVGTPSTVSRHAPPGRKVGRLSPKKKRRK
ncbi:MAG: 50S ribosomal protein L2 [Thermoplasmata archaeon]|nr:50S ribosomal protein L2 [Thermoplasmata archaeon]